MDRNWLIAGGLAALGGSMVAGSLAAAATTSGTMAVGVTVEPACNLDLAPLAFGSVTSDRPRAEAQATMTVDCTPDTPFTVAIDEGTTGARRMAGPAGHAALPYEIYQDPARTRRWGNTAREAVGAVAPSSGRIVLAAYGRIDAAAAAAGSYGDTVAVTVAF